MINTKFQGIPYRGYRTPFSLGNNDPNCLLSKEIEHNLVKNLIYCSGSLHKYAWAIIPTMKCLSNGSSTWCPLPHIINSLTYCRDTVPSPPPKKNTFTFFPLHMFYIKATSVRKDDVNHPPSTPPPCPPFHLSTLHVQHIESLNCAMLNSHNHLRGQ